MPVNELEPEPEPTIADRFMPRVRAVTGTSDRMPLRVLILFILTGACVTLAPTPINIIGVAALFMLALDTVTHRR